MQFIKFSFWKKICFLTIIIVAVAVAVAVGCERQKPVKLGYVGPLTGRLSDLGVSGRNGMMLAVEEINKTGGIHGRSVELILKDDKNEPQMAVRVDKELIEEGVVAIIGHMTRAMICQQVRKLGSNIPVVSCGRAKTSDLLRHGGNSVEGIVFAHIFNKESKHKGYLRFKTRFKKRFGKEPDFAAVNSYEAAQVLFNALSRTDEIAKLKGTILNQSIFQGVQGDIRIDEYGDARRRFFLVTVKDGQFIVMPRP